MHRNTRTAAKVFVALLVGGILAGASRAATGADERQDVWLRGDGIARVKVASCGAALCMTNVWIKPGVQNEKVGEYISFDLRAVGPGQWKGNGHDPQRNLDFSTEMTVTGDAMTTSGCILGGVVCRTTQWTRFHQ